MIGPSGSLEPEPSKVAARKVLVDVNAAVGAWFGATTLTSWLTVSVACPASVTVSVTV